MPIIIEKLKSVHADSGQKVDLCLVDFANNSFVDVRDSLLIALCDSFSTSRKYGLCDQFIVLLPQLPGDESASLRQFAQLSALPSEDNLTVTLLANSGAVRSFGASGRNESLTILKYPRVARARSGSPETQLDRRCVKRLGHFRTDKPPNRRSDCRVHSYFIHQCDREFLRLFSNWREKYTKECHVILYDLKYNSSFRNAVKAYAERHSLISARVEDVLSDSTLADKLAKWETCSLILDVVETGTLAFYYIQRLKKLGIRVNPDVLSAIIKGGSKDVNIGGYHIHGFLNRPPDPAPTSCPQCYLGLPTMSDGPEAAGSIRTFDMLYMADLCGYEQEPIAQVPENIGAQFPVIPNFKEILARYGSWIGYKMYNFLKSGLLPDKWFIIHPAEGDSDALVAQLRVFFDEPIFELRVPRDDIKEAQKRMNDWHDVIEKAKRGSWVAQLRDMREGASAVIVNIFNGSWSTANTLATLLCHFQIQPFSYICLVNFLPTLKTLQENGAKVYSLYDWYNPRTLLQRSAENVSGVD